MSTAIDTTNGQQLIDSQRASRYLGVRPATLAVWRCTGRYDLPFVKVGRHVRYRLADLDAWLASRTATSTD